MTKRITIRDIDKAIQNINHCDRITECFNRLKIPYDSKLYLATCDAGKVEMRLTVGSTHLYFGNGKYIGIGEKPQRQTQMEELSDIIESMRGL